MEIINNTPFEIETLPGKGPEGNTVLTIIVKGTFDIRPDEVVSVASEQIPVSYADELYDEDGGSVRLEADIAPFKPRADIALVGKAYAPDGKPVESLDATLWVGNLSKTIRVFGDRHWDFGGRLMPAYVSDPEPFTVMDIVYERAFGGMDLKGGDWCKENPVGRGFFVKKLKETIDEAPLPNLETPNNLIKYWDDHPDPVGFGFCGKMWMPRSLHLGTYDEKWRKERSPDRPRDFSFDYYNAAHPDLQVEGYLQGDERVELINLTPDGRIRFQLPGIGLLGNVTKTSKYEEADDSNSGQEVQDETMEEVEFNLDTLCLIPDEERLFIIWRGLCPIKDLTTLEVKDVEITAVGGGFDIG